MRSDQPAVYRKRPEFLFVELSVNNVSILCGVAYNTPKAGFWSDVEEAILNCNKSFDFTVVMGDFNIEWHRDSSSRRTLRDFLTTCLLTPLPFQPTHVLDNSQSTIDYICVSDVNRVSRYSQVEHPSISKHHALFATLNFPVSSRPPDTVIRRVYKNFNIVSLLETLRAYDWDALTQATDVEIKVNIFTHAMLAAYDLHAPLSAFKITPRPRFPISPHTKGIINARNLAWSKLKRRECPTNRLEYRRLRNLAQKLIRNDGYAHYSLQFSLCKNSITRWKLVDKLGITKSSTRVEMPADPDAFNRDFVALNDNEPTLAHYFIDTDAQPVPEEEKFYFRHVTIQDLTEAVSKARSNALGPDKIPLRHIKECLDVLFPFLLNIFDTSLQSSIFPSNWKKAIVRPLPKNSNATTVAEFRPISILCAASKLLEYVAHKQIAAFIEERKVLCTNQSGFRKGYSCHTALIKIVDDIRIAINNGLVTILVGIDFSRAFDLVNIDLLLIKLRKLGFSDPAVEWVSSFLHGRSQIVTFQDGRTSQPMVRLAGVPQGSLFGPPFFALFINDLPSVLDYCKYHLYADDFDVYYSGQLSDLGSIIQKVNHDLAKIAQWALFNGLTINPRKTQAAWIGSRGYISQLNKLPLSSRTLRMSEHVVIPSDTIKILGLTIDSTLSWRDQSNITARKSFAALARLRKCHGYLPRDTRLMLVKTLVFPYFDYCAGVFLDLSDELTTKLSRCKNAAIRFVTGTKKWEHITADYIQLEILPFKQRRDLLALCLLATVLRSRKPKYIDETVNFRRREAIGGRRHSPWDLEIRNWDLDYFRYSFQLGIAYLWNELPNSVRIEYHNLAFKTTLFKHLFDSFAGRPD